MRTWYRNSCFKLFWCKVSKISIKIEKVLLVRRITKKKIHLRTLRHWCLRGTNYVIDVRGIHINNYSRRSVVLSKVLKMFETEQENICRGKISGTQFFRLVLYQVTLQMLSTELSDVLKLAVILWIIPGQLLLQSPCKIMWEFRGPNINCYLLFNDSREIFH